MKMVIKFKMDNAAFDDQPEKEVLRILSKVSGEVIAGRAYNLISDVNGNTVGEWGINSNIYDE